MKIKLLKGTALAITGLLMVAGFASVSANAATTTWPIQGNQLKGTTLTIWAAANSNTIPKSVIAGFQKATHATVKVVTIPDAYEQNVQTKIATGDKPDLAFWQPTSSELAAINATTNLQSLDGAPFLKTYKGNLANVTGTLNGTHYAALISTPSIIGVYYNKDVFKAAGITSTPKNWTAFIADAKKIKAAGTTPFYEMGGDKWGTQWFVQVLLADAAKGGLWDRVNANKEKFTDPTILGAINTYNSLINDGLFNADIKTGTFAEQGTALLGGQVGMAMQVNSFFGELQAQATTAQLNAKIGFFPISPKGSIGTFIPDQSNALVAFNTGNAKRMAASRQFLTYWLGRGYKGFINAQSTVSIIKGMPSPKTVPQALTDAANSFGNSVGSMQALAVANPDLYLNLANMIQGTMTPLQVAQTTQTQFAQLAQAQGIAAFK